MVREGKAERQRKAEAETSICRSRFLRSSSNPLPQGQRRLPEIRFKRLVGLIPPLSYSLPLRTDFIERYSIVYTYYTTYKACPRYRTEP